MGEKNKNEKKDRKEVEWGNGDNELRETTEYEYEDGARRDDNNRDNGDNELLEEVTLMKEKKDSKHKKD